MPPGPKWAPFEIGSRDARIHCGRIKKGTGKPSPEAEDLPVLQSTQLLTLSTASVNTPPKKHCANQSEVCITVLSVITQTRESAACGYFANST